MTDAEFRAFFREWAPELGLREDGYRRVGGTVRERVARRLVQLRLPHVAGYAERLRADASERLWLESACRITVSRFGRDAEVFAALAETVLPALALDARHHGRAAVRVWSAGSASGEEAYSIAIAFWTGIAPRHPGLGLQLLGTDAEPVVVARAERAGYPPGCLRELPEGLRERAFERRRGEYFLRPEFRAGVRFALADLRAGDAPGSFDLVLCRNLAFTYFDDAGQMRALDTLARAARPGGVLVIGRGERLPQGATEWFSPGFECCYLRN